jgi:hypothetical protein
MIIKVLKSENIPFKLTTVHMHVVHSIQSATIAGVL